MQHKQQLRHLIRLAAYSDVPSSARPLRFTYTDPSQLVWVLAPPALKLPSQPPPDNAV